MGWGEGEKEEKVSHTRVRERDVGKGGAERDRYRQIAREKMTERQYTAVFFFIH